MSVDPNTKEEYSGVDPLVSETLDSALEQLHLDDLGEDTASTIPQELKVPNVDDAYSYNTGIVPSHMFPHPQMIGMGFIPFQQMIHVPQQNGFFPPPEFGNTGPPMGTNAPDAIMFNNSTDGSVFSSGNPVTQPETTNFRAALINDKTAPAPTGPNDPLWYASNPRVQTMVDPVAASSAIEDSAFLDDRFPPRAPGGAIRRQTFHAISTNDLINTAAASAVAEPDSTTLRIPESTRASPSIRSEKFPSSIPTNSTAQTAAVRTQSTSLEGSDGQQLFGKKEDSIDGSRSTEIGKGKEPTYAAAYPYGGPLLHPNPVLAGHSPPVSQPAYGIPSPFHGAYGFASHFQFSPVIGNPNSQVPVSNSPNAHSLTQIPVLADAAMTPTVNSHPNAKNVSSPPEDQSNIYSPHQAIHQQGGKPPPWLYGSHPFGMAHPHSIPQGHPHMMHPSSVHALNNHTNQMNGRGGSHNGGNRGGRTGYSGNSKNKHNKNSHFYHNGSFSGEKHRKNEDASRYADANLQDFVGSIYSLCKDQHGCRFLQKQLDLLGSEAADLIFTETRDYTVELMTDSFGNYLVQKLLERVNLEQRITLTRIAAPHFLYIATNPHGTRALQKLVESIETSEEAKIIIDSLKDSIVQLSKDLNGNHIVQKCLQKLKPENLQFIFDAVCNNCINVATHRHGCCVLQRCLDHGSYEQRQALCMELLAHVNVLTLDPFGNYVVQYIITKESEDKTYKFTDRIVDILTPKLCQLSLHKFGSNVIEKILRTPEVSDSVISSFLKNNGETEVQALLNDCYGNYVLQTMLDMSRDNSRVNYERLLEVVRPLIVGPVRNTPHGRRIVSILQLDQSATNV